MNVLQTRLEEMAKTVKMQQIMDRNRANASNLLTLDSVKQMSMYQDRMQTFLAPFLHRDRHGPCPSAAKLCTAHMSLRSSMSSKCPVEMLARGWMHWRMPISLKLRHMHRASLLCTALT